MGELLQDICPKIEIHFSVNNPEISYTNSTIQMINQEHNCAKVFFIGFGFCKYWVIGIWAGLGVLQLKNQHHWPLNLKNF